MAKEESLEDISAREIRRIIRKNAPAHTPKDLPESGEELLATPQSELKNAIETAYGRPMTCSPISSSHKEHDRDYKSSIRTPWHEYVRRTYYGIKGEPI
jgi:hypothetical protein